MSSGRNHFVPLVDPDDDDDDNLDTDDSGTDDAETARAKEASTSFHSGLGVDDYSDFERLYEDLESELPLTDGAVGGSEQESDDDIFTVERCDATEIPVFDDLLGCGKRNNQNMDGVKPRAEDVAVGPVKEFSAYDILCGRGEHVNRNPGNKRFHEVKKRLQPRYVQATRRKEKTAIAQELVDTMRCEYGSRFLAHCPETGKFVEVDNRRVLEKTKQALREVFTAEQRSLKRQRFSAALRLKKQLLNAGLGKPK